jgi:hypothetical protein
MNRRSLTALLVVTLSALTLPASAAGPTAESIVNQSISAAEVESSLAEHDMLRLAIRQEETASDGSTDNRDMTVLFHGGGLDNVRVELGGGVTLVLNNGTGWAMVRGELDTRVQTPRMAAGTIRQSLFPLLLPYSFRMSGVLLSQTVVEGSFDGTPAWVLEANFDPDFFAAPSMLTTWRFFISREDSSVLGAEFLPPPEFHSVNDEGVRYRYLKTRTVDGLVLPTQILLDGTDLNGVENGHVRVTKITPKTVGPLDLTLFVHPDEMKRLDEGDIF